MQTSYVYLYIIEHNLISTKQFKLIMVGGEFKGGLKKTERFDSFPFRTLMVYVPPKPIFYMNHIMIFLNNTTYEYILL